MKISKSRLFAATKGIGRGMPDSNYRIPWCRCETGTTAQNGQSAINLGEVCVIDCLLYVLLCFIISYITTSRAND